MKGDGNKCLDHGKFAKSASLECKLSVEWKLG